MGFRFPLSVVLQVRLRAEEREELLLKQILAELAKANGCIADIDHLLKAAHGNRMAGAGTSTTGFDLCALYGEIENLNRQRSGLEEQVGKLEQLRDKQMQVYRAARQNRETIERLLEQQCTAYQLDADKREQRDLGDIASGQHFRKKSSAKLRASSDR